MWASPSTPSPVKSLILSWLGLVNVCVALRLTAITIPSIYTTQLALDDKSQQSLINITFTNNFQTTSRSMPSFFEPALDLFNAIMPNEQVAIPYEAMACSG
jgi:exoribonuclease R